MKKMLLLLVPMLVMCSMQSNALDTKKEALAESLCDYCNKRADDYKKYTEKGIRFPGLFSREGDLTPEEALQQENKLTSGLEQGCKYVGAKLADDAFVAKLQDADNFDYGQAPFMRDCYKELGWAYEGKEGSANMYERLELMHVLQALNKNIQ